MNNIFLPNDLINTEYKYDYLDNGNVIIYTNNVCNGWHPTENYKFQYVVNTNNHYRYTRTCAPALVEGDVNTGTKINTLTGNILLSSSDFTSDFWFRNDLDSILFIFLVLSIFIVFIPYKIISRWFGRWLKV